MTAEPTHITMPANTDVELKTDYPTVDPKTVFLGGLFVLALLAAITVASEIVMPIILAFTLKAVLQPVMRLFERMHIPRVIGALAVIMLLMGTVVAIGSALSTPAAEWASKLPQEFPKLKERLQDLRNPIAPIQRVLSDAQNLTLDKNNAVTVVTVQSQALPEKFLDYTRHLATGLFEMLLVLFFLLVSGDTFLRRLVEILPRFQDKKQAINISNQIEHDISAYLVTITFMNMIVGVGAALAMWSCGVENPLLWGVVAFLFNYVPIVGPIVCSSLFLMVGLMSENALLPAVTPALLYLGVHLIESMIFLFWMWGIPGAILSMPIIAMIKIVCDHIEHLKPFGHFIEN
jgi:predicted PurR-regulated permease PerM